MDVDISSFGVKNVWRDANAAQHLINYFPLENYIAGFDMSKAHEKVKNQSTEKSKNNFILADRRE